MQGRALLLSWIAPLKLDPYLNMLSVKQGGIKETFLSFCMIRLGIELCSLNHCKHSKHPTNEFNSYYYKFDSHWVSPYYVCIRR